MPPRTTPPYRLRYKSELNYPAKGDVFRPTHGSGPRCKVYYDPNVDGPWATLKIMRISDDVEHYECLMPRYYAIPLILINKHLAFYEAQCHPDGTTLPSSSSCRIKQHELREYTYLWRLRCRFLQAVFDMNHDRILRERWEYEGIHGFLHRMYRRFGHDISQRGVYWRGEIKEGRVPYTVPDIAEMDWKAYLLEDMTTTTRLNAFLWNRVSQGYSRVVKDEPPFESWRAWRAGHHRDHNTAPYLTPSSSPVREPPSEGDGVSAAAAAAVAAVEQAMTMTTTQGCSSGSNCGAGGYDTAVVTAPPPMQAAMTATATAAAESAIGSRRGVGVVAAAAGIAGNGDGGKEEEELEYTDVAVLKADLTDLPSSQQSTSTSASSTLWSGGTDRSTSTNMSSKGRPLPTQISLKYDVRGESMELAVVHCIFTKPTKEGVNPRNPRLEVTYEENIP